VSDNPNNIHVDPLNIGRVARDFLVSRKGVVSHDPHIHRETVAYLLIAAKFNAQLKEELLGFGAEAVAHEEIKSFWDRLKG
jgi:hypothetical protein